MKCCTKYTFDQNPVETFACGKIKDKVFHDAYEGAWSGHYSFEEIFVVEATVIRCLLGGQTAGVIIIDLADDRTIRMVYVVPEFRRKGIATSLLKKARKLLGKAWKPSGTPASPEGAAMMVKLGIAHHTEIVLRNRT